MVTRYSETACLFCGRQFDERDELFTHFGRRHLPEREEV